MKANKPLRIGLILLAAFILIQLIGNLFFELRNEQLFTFILIIEFIAILIIATSLLIGLFKVQNGLKWLLILPLLLFILFYALGTLFFPSFPNEVRIKEDSEVLFVNKFNRNKKIIKQVNWTGITGSNIHIDTLKVNEFSTLLRLARPIEAKELGSEWIKVQYSD